MSIPRVGKGGGGGGGYASSARRSHGYGSSGRRDAHAIREDLRAIEESIRKDAAQPRSGPVMDELEKERLAFHMTFRSNPPAELKDLLERKARGEAPAGGSGKRPAAPPPGRGGGASTAEEAERLFQEVLLEPPAASGAPCWCCIE